MGLEQPEPNGTTTVNYGVRPNFDSALSVWFGIAIAIVAILLFGVTSIIHSIAALRQTKTMQMESELRQDSGIQSSNQLQIYVNLQKEVEELKADIRDTKRMVEEEMNEFRQVIRSTRD